MKKVKKESKKYPSVLDEIEFDINLGVTHADNIANNEHLLGEKSMLAKVKEALTK